MARSRLKGRRLRRIGLIGCRPAGLDEPSKRPRSDHRARDKGSSDTVPPMSLFATMAVQGTRGSGTDVVGIGLALGAAALWGTSDYLGGRASTTRPATTVFSSSQLASVVALLAVVGLMAVGGVGARPLPNGHDIGLAIAAGAGHVIGLIALYWALSRGPVGVIAPGSALLATIVPVSAGVFLYGAPTPVVTLGVVAAVVAAVLLAGPGRAKSSLPILGATVVSGLGFALQASALGTVDRAGPLVVTVSEVAAMVLVGGYLVLRRMPLLAGCRPRGIDTLCGVLRVGGTLAYTLAAAQGLTVAAALSALYPAGTLAWYAAVNRTVPSRVQGAGITLALLAGVLVALK